MSERSRNQGDQRIVRYWESIAAAWSRTIREGRIESRALVTNDAVIETVLSRSPVSVLDLGCGEGWLCRELAARGIRVTGIDAVPELILEAKALGGAEYHAVSFEQIAEGALGLKADVVVCNFSLLGKESVEGLMARMPSLLKKDGALVVQTLHPANAAGGEPYQDGWRESPWTGITDDISRPSPWYFRTLENWIRLFTENHLRVIEVREPVYPATLRPASILFVVAVSPSYL